MLQKELLINEIRKLNDSSFEEFTSFPMSCGEAVKSWSNCFLIYSEEMLPTSSNFQLAKSECENVLSGICSSSNMVQSALIFKNAIETFAIKVSEGISPASSSLLNGIPPTYSLNVLPLFIKSMQGGSSLEFAISLAEEVDKYFKTGTAINVNTGVTINWS